MLVRKISLVLFSIFILTESIIVQTQYGFIRGNTKTTETGRLYYNFQGIPYGRPPIGTLRFRDAVAPIAWNNAILNCTTESPAFWGINGLTGQIEGDFDALRLNVYTNNISPETGYPVMVWIHGGGWQAGDAGTDIYGPDYLIEKNVTLVTMNYRLGAFGFLSLDDPQLNIPGNQAFKDQRMALKWVQRNIAHFGGDPNNVTLFGQSSGGGSVHYHMISESSRALFHRGILMAGTALHNGYYEVPRRSWAQRLASRLGFNSTVDSEILTFLENASPEDIILQQIQLLSFEESFVERIVVPFGPTIEQFDTAGVFLNDDIPTLVQNAWGNSIDIILGAVSFEGLGLISTLRAVPEIFDAYADFENQVPRELNVTRKTAESKRYGQMLKETYYGMLTPTVTNIDGIMLGFSDNVLWYPAHRTIRYRIQSGSNAKTFVYRFDADSQNNIIKALTPGVELYREPLHVDDVTHLFKTILHKPLAEMDVMSYNTLQLMVSLFTQFAITGSPEIENITWNSVESQELSDVLLIGLNIKENYTQFGTLPEASRMKTFDRIFEIERSGAASMDVSGFVKIITAILLNSWLL